MTNALSTPDPGLPTPAVPGRRPPVVALVTDLMFATRIADAIRHQGADPILASSAAELRQALDRWPELVLIDLHALPAEEWQPEVRRAKSLPQSRAISIVAFGSHVDTGALKAARAAGCDHVWARSRFVEGLPQLVANQLNPPVRYPEGWDDQPTPAFLQGVALFNAGQFYKQHDVFERLWMEDQRPIRDLYQGILQIGVAFHHVEDGNYRGAVKMLRRGLPRLRGLPATCQTLDVASLRQAARAVHDELVALGPEHMDQVDRARLHQIKLRLVTDSPAS